MTGYIPEGRVWTEKDRGRNGLPDAPDINAAVGIAVKTVAALIRVAEDVTDALADALKRDGDATDEERDIVEGSRALLAALKGKD